MEKKLKPMTLKEFHEMIDHSKEDVEEGRILSHDALKKKVKTWK